MVHILQGASFPELTFCFTVIYLAQFAMYITDIKVNDRRKSDIFLFVLWKSSC